MCGNYTHAHMSRDRRDAGDSPFDATFRLMEGMIEQTARNLDLLLGPFGSVDVNVDSQSSSGRRRTEPTDEATIDVQTSDGEIEVVADMFGTTPEDIEIACADRTLAIRAKTDDRYYDERVQFPVSVDPSSASASFNNGVLAVTVAPSERSDDSPVAVE
jgi:HSP20 family protein